MTLADKVRYLRQVEGELRGLHRELTQREVVDGIAQRYGGKLSQPYLSQIESGRRRHLTNTTRLLLSRYFRVHPGYFVDDPEEFHTELQTHAPGLEESIDLWLVRGAESFVGDAALADALLAIARERDTRRLLLLLHAIVKTPGLGEQLWDLLSPEQKEEHAHDR